MKRTFISELDFFNKNFLSEEIFVWFFIFAILPGQLKQNFLRMKCWKAGRFERMSLADNSQPIVKRDSHVARAPLHNTLPVFLNLHGILGLHFWSLKKLENVRNHYPAKIM